MELEDVNTVDNPVNNHYILVTPSPKIDGENCRIVDINDTYIAVFVPGRTVYIDSVSGTQYRPAEYIISMISRIYEGTYFATEILRFGVQGR